MSEDRLGFEIDDEAAELLYNGSLSLPLDHDPKTGKLQGRYVHYGTIEGSVYAGAEDPELKKLWGSK